MVKDNLLIILKHTAYTAYYGGKKTINISTCFFTNNVKVIAHTSFTLKYSY